MEEENIGEHESPGTVAVSRGGAAAKQNGTREVHHVTFAESHTEHGGTDQSEEESVIQEDATAMAATGPGSTVKFSPQNSVAYVNGHGTHVAVVNSDLSPSAGILSSQTERLSLSYNTSLSVSGSSSPSSPQVAPLTPIIKLQRSASTESHENPFTADGELHKKADYIISHSTISRTELKIEDPDQMKSQPQPVVDEDCIQPTSAGGVQSAPPGARPNDINVKDQNGKLDDPVAPSSVEVVEKGNATQPQPEQAEEVKVKDNKKCKCCVIM